MQKVRPEPHEPRQPKAAVTSHAVALEIELGSFYEEGVTVTGGGRQKIFFQCHYFSIDRFFQDGGI